MRISDWSSDVCSSDLLEPDHLWLLGGHDRLIVQLELVFGERFPKGPFHVEPVIDLLLQIEVEMPVNAPAVALCMIKREIRRSDARRVGKECVRTCSSRWLRYHYKKQKDNIYNTRQEVTQTIK